MGRERAEAHRIDHRDRPRHFVHMDRLHAEAMFMGTDRGMQFRCPARGLFLDFRRHQAEPRPRGAADAPSERLSGQPEIGALSAKLDVLDRDLPVAGFGQSAIDQVRVVGHALLKCVGPEAGIPIASGFDPSLGGDGGGFGRESTFPMIEIVAGLETFQQCVAYYFNLINRRSGSPRYREIPIEDIEFGGEGAYLGLTGKALRRRVRGATRAWFRLMSAEIQEEAARRAAKLHAAISAHEHGLGMEAVHVNKVARAVAVVDPMSFRTLATHSFAIPKTLYYRLNARRALQYEWFGGGGVDVRRPPVRAFLGFMAFRYDWAEKIREWIYEEPPIAIGQKLQPLAKPRL